MTCQKCGIEFHGKANQKYCGSASQRYGCSFSNARNEWRKRPSPRVKTKTGLSYLDYLRKDLQKQGKPEAEIKTFVKAIQNHWYNQTPWDMRVLGPVPGESKPKAPKTPLMSSYGV